MKKHFILIPFFIFFSCSDITTDRKEGEKDDDSRSSNREGKSRRDGGAADERNSVKKVCKGESYTLYSYNECPKPVIKVAKRPVDILFVVDTSTSMYFYLNNAFKKRFKNFISIINNLDWRILFTDAAYSGGSFFSLGMDGEAMKLEGEDYILDRYYLDHTVPNYVNVFNYTITREPHRISERGDDGDECSYPPYCQGSEKPLRALHASFSANKRLTRKEADFAVVIISNTDENSAKGSSAITHKEIINEFNKVYGSEKELMVFSIIVLPDDDKCKKENDAQQFWFPESKKAEKIAALAPKTGGGNFSICLDDYSIVAKSIVNLVKQ